MNGIVILVNLRSGYNTVSRKKKLSLPEGLTKGDLPSVVVEDTPNNPTSADFSFHIRIVGFLTLKFKIFTISVLHYFFICCDFNEKL